MTRSWGAVLQAQALQVRYQVWRLTVYQSPCFVISWRSKLQAMQMLISQPAEAARRPA